MHARFRMKGVLLAALVAVLAAAVLPGAASAEPQPGAKKRGFRLFARSLGAMTINRIYCGLATTGEVCVDSTNSSTIGGGFWPKGTADQYVFNSGLQLAGIIGPDGGPWAGDTVGAFFFDPKGTTQHGEQVMPIYNATGLNSLGQDAQGDQWAEAACVPSGTDADASLFSTLLQNGTDDEIAPGCRISASQGDVWFLSWEGNPTVKAGRKHPLGVVVETRGLGWNFPKGNEDILYFIYSFYNVTANYRAAYDSIRAPLADILYQKALDFHAANLAQGVDLPDSGYTITNLFAAFAADMDVANAGSNYSGVNLPFALGNTYDRTFSSVTNGWTFDPSIFSPPFFGGAGFVGVKYLKSPTGAGAIQLFSNTVNGQPFPNAVNDPRDVVQLYRYLSGTLSPATGDQPCNTGNPATTRICFVNNTAPADMRFFQSSTPLNLPPGGRGSIVVAYIFAAPVAVGSCPGTGCDVKPGDGRFMTDAAQLTSFGANQMDSISGYRGFTDINGDGEVQQDEISVVPGSLLGKSLVAQAVFDAKFLLPFAPIAPEFFLVPGDNQVTVLWKPSPSENLGDPYFAIANQATVGGGDNSLYDPNYRQFDVEGYRVYRGRVDAPNELTLLAQFDYAGTTISDYTGIVNPSTDCAPEYGITAGCPAAYPAGGNQKDGTTLTAHTDYDLAGDIIQVNAGSGRLVLQNGTAYVVKPDTAVTADGTNGTCGPKSACPALDNTGVPFVFVDQTPRNNFRYFYAVTAFDVNSIESGPTSLESPRNTKSATPVHKASNYAGTGQITSTQIVGRGTVLTDATMPTLDPATGRFSKMFPPSNAWSIGLGAFVSKVLAAPGALSATLDSINMGSAYQGVPAEYWFTVTSPSQTLKLMIPMTQPTEVGVTQGSVGFSAISIDQSLASRYGGNNTYTLPGSLGMMVNGPDYLGLYGRGCVNGRPGFTATYCDYNGSRWFDGPSPANNETKDDPNGCNTTNFASPVQRMTCFNNAGELSGVTTIFNAQCYQSSPGGGCRESTGIWSGVRRAADFNVYWGASGHIDSVVDATHNVQVPGPDSLNYANVVSASWGILNTSATTGTQPDGRAELTQRDFACVEPMRTYAVGSFTCPAGNSAYVLSSTAVPGAVAFFSGLAYPNATNTVPGANNGFGLYIVGDIFTIELAGGAVPAAGTVWSLRTYAGAITGGNGSGGNGDPYTFSNPEGRTLTPDNQGIRPFTSLGSIIQTTFDVDNSISAVTGAGLKQVHTVPDPYYVTNGYEQTTDTKIIKFVNLPRSCIIRIYSSSGVLVNVLEHNSSTLSGEETWNVRNRNNQVVASGVYFYHIESNDGATARRVGRMTIVNFAQ